MATVEHSERLMTRKAQVRWLSAVFLVFVTLVYFGCRPSYPQAWHDAGKLRLGMTREEVLAAFPHDLLIADKPTPAKQGQREQPLVTTMTHFAHSNRYWEIFSGFWIELKFEKGRLTNVERTWIDD